MKRLFIYILVGAYFASTVTGCGDDDASISLLSTNMKLQLSANEPKKLQMVIIGDPTESMAEVQTELRDNFPALTRELVKTGFNFDIFCATTSFNGGEVTTLKDSAYRSGGDFDFNRLNQDIGNCINTSLDTNLEGDERGLEAAKKTWEKVISSKVLDSTAVKLTMIVTNEDDCSRDLGKYPLNAEGAKCKDQSARPGTQSPMLDAGNSEIAHLFPASRYAEFFNKYLTYEEKDKKEGVVRKRGHIFAPMILQPPADIGKDKAQACIQKRVNSLSEEFKKTTPGYVMSYGFRYFEVAEATSNKTYSLCENIGNTLADVNTDVQNEVAKKSFFLDRRPENPNDLRVKITRKISDESKASRILGEMEKENSLSAAENRWNKVSNTVWEKILTVGNGFNYIQQTNEIVFNNDKYEPYNDVLTILNYQPAGFDGKVNYGSNAHLNQ